MPTTADDGYSHGLYNNVPIVTQIYNYLGAVHNVADPNALYMISYGGNDLIWLQNQAPPGFQPLPYIQSLATALDASIAALQAAGARTIVVLNVYAYAKLVGPGGSLTPANATVVNQAATYSAEVWSGLGAAGVNFIPADVEGVLRYASQNPTSFGFTPATVLASSPACGTTVGLVCAPAQLVSPDAQQTYLWGDAEPPEHGGADDRGGLHLQPARGAEPDFDAGGKRRSERPVARGHHPEADRSVRTASRAERRQRLGQRRGEQPEHEECAGLPQRVGHARSAARWARIIRRPAGSSSAWRSRQAARPRGFPPSGHFNQTAEAFSLYAAYSAGPLWGNAIAGYGLLQNHIARQVTLGRFIDQNDGDADGHSLALALRGGYDLHLGPVTTGPVAGAVLQQVRIDGFTETGSSGVTALSFGSQTRGSAVTQLGWRVSLDAGNWQPFADVEWNHEWADKNRTITASLTSIAAPSWSSAAAPIAANWASGSVGVSYRINPQVIVGAAASAEFINPRATSYGGELGLNVSF